MYLSPRERARTKFITRLKIYGGIFLVGLIAEGTVWLIIWLPPLHITTVNVVGNVTASERAMIVNEIVTRHVSPRYAGFFGFDHILSWPKNDVALNRPEIERVTITKDLLHQTLIIAVKPRTPYGEWCVADICHEFDASGVIFDMPKTAEIASLITVISNENPTSVPSRLLLVFAYLKERFPRLEKIEWRNDNRELWVATADGPILHISTRFDPTTNLRALTELQSRPLFNKLSYVDLRIENRIYYK